MVYIYECPECQHKQEESRTGDYFCPMCANYRMVWSKMVLSMRKAGEIKEQSNEEVSED
jgi:hypothetical protein